jgi:hypothetical protein
LNGYDAATMASIVRRLSPALSEAQAAAVVLLHTLKRIAHAAQDAPAGAPDKST